MPSFDDYPEYEKKMYADYTRWCERKGIDSHWDDKGNYKHYCYPHTSQVNIWETAEREQEVRKKLNKHMDIKREQERIERDKQHNSPWKNEHEERERKYKIAEAAVNHRAAEDQRRKIDVNHRAAEDQRRKIDVNRRVAEAERQEIAAAIQLLSRYGIQTVRE